jgi:hypothetical protein
MALALNDRVQQTKVCAHCKAVKALFDFSPAPSRRDGYYAYCKVCAREKQRNRYKNNTNGHRDKDNHHSTKNHYRKKYGLADDVIKEIMLSREGVCAICNTKTKLVVDHCHTTGKIRGRICGLCNTMIGHARDSVENLQSAIKYLQESNKWL